SKQRTPGLRESLLWVKSSGSVPWQRRLRWHSLMRINEGLSPMDERNNLFPVFLKLESLHTLLVGGGNVGLEKLNAVLKSSPAARVTIVAGIIRDEIKALAADNAGVQLIERDFRESDLDNKDLVVLATDDPALH